MTGEKFMSDLHLKQWGFNYSACGPFTKHCGRIQEYKQKGNLKHLYKNELVKACFVHDAEYSDSKDLTKRTISDNILKDRAYEIIINCKYDECQRTLASMMYKLFLFFCFIKNSRE